eukprot:227168-Alexandrium_andersonii.AAC.1
MDWAGWAAGWRRAGESSWGWARARAALAHSSKSRAPRGISTVTVLILLHTPAAMTWRKVWLRGTYKWAKDGPWQHK